MRVNAQLPSLRAQLGPVFFLAVIFFLNFVSRIILSPLLPTIEKELAINHSQAGFLFFLSSGGYLVGLLSSGLLAARASHRWAIVISGVGVGMAMLSIASAQNLSMIRCGLFGVGFSAGLYMPSAIATITSLVDKRHWGKAISVHELAPNLAFFLSPFIAEFFLAWSGWRAALGTIGGLSIVASLTFYSFGRGGAFPGESPFSNAFASLMRTPSYWLMVILFARGRQLDGRRLCHAAALSRCRARPGSELGQYDRGLFPRARAVSRLAGRMGFGQARRQANDRDQLGIYRCRHRNLGIFAG